MSAADLPERARLLASSWQGSQDHGVSLEDVEPVFTGACDEGGSLFRECGQEVLTHLHRTLANEPISLMLTDAEGRVLADPVPSVVPAEEQHSLSLCTYTCAAVPVLDPLTGRLEGAVNVTTWSGSSSDLLLALAQSAASATTALMLARSRGARPRPAPRGQVFRVETDPGAGTLRDLSPAWTDAVARAESAFAAGRVVAAVGEPGAGRATMLAQAQRRVRPSDRILAASTPASGDVDPWVRLWSAELATPHTAAVVGDVEPLPVEAAERLRALVAQATDVPFSVTAARFDDIPAPLASLVDVVVQVPPLRERPDDVLPLARHAARRARGRAVELTPAAVHALTDHGWPGNVDQLNRVIRYAASRTDVIDVRHLSSEVLSGTARRLTRIEAFERDEIVRILTRPGITMKGAAAELGMSRATIYRKVAQYDLHLPRR
jgi:hypothetical protein